MGTERSLLRSLSKGRRIVIFALLISLALLVCFVLNMVDLELLLLWSDRVPVLPTAQAEYRQILDRIASATNDELLEDETNAEPRLYRYGLGCIAAQSSRAFGTNRPHADIVADFTKVFLAMGWKFEGFEGPAYSTKKAWVVIKFVEPVSPDFATLGKGRYQTVYWVDVMYSDPQVFGCSY